MNFAEIIKEEEKWTTTENGAVAKNTTGNALLDFYSIIGGLRNADEDRITSLFEEAMKVDNLRAIKTVFYARDIRGGLGERRVFRILLKYIANNYPDIVEKNIDYIPFYGRFDDWYELVGTPLENFMFSKMKEQFYQDIEDMRNNKPISLLAKWIKSADSKNYATRELGIRTALSFGWDVRSFKEQVRKMRKYLKITERYMSANEWEDIQYSSVPSKAMNNYYAAFQKHDAERFDKYLEDVKNGTEKINTQTLYPYDILHKCIDIVIGYHQYGMNGRKIDEKTINILWDNLPNYIEGDNNVIVVADTSGSMYYRPLEIAVSLALYFAQRNTGAYNGLWMNFSNHPTFQKIKGKTLTQMISNMNIHNWGMSTNLHAVFDEILNLAIENNVSSEEMPKAIIVISDMEINACTDERWTFYDQIKAEYEDKGYTIPNVIFWNAESRNNIFHADYDRKGVQLCSGASAITFKNVLDSINSDPIEAMKKVLDSDRYKCITIGL